MDEELIKQVIQNLSDFQGKQIRAVLDMMDEGNTVPFIARYRKERTGSLDEVAIRQIEDEANRVQKLAKRRSEVINQITEQGKMTEALTAQINHAATMQTLEDLYLPYKQKRRTKATIAKEAGLEPFATWLLSFPADGIEAKARTFINDDVETVEDVLAGAHEILAEAFGDHPKYRQWIRQYTNQNGLLTSTVKSKGKEKDEQQVYQLYYDFEEKIGKLSSYQVLAINRGEKAGVLNAGIAVNSDSIMQYGYFQVVQSHQGPAVALVIDAFEDAYKRFIGPSIERDIRRELTEQADQHAIGVFGENLYHLLMQAPMSGRVVMGFDPAYRTGCKLAIMDANGKFLAKQVIYPHKPASQTKRAAAKGEFEDLIAKYHVEMIAIGNGTASRESEQFVADILKELPQKVYYVIVNEAGASVYSASEVARHEFPDLHVEERSAVSIGRRLQDPLAELVKIDPKAVGVGQYQHDVPEKELDEQLDRVIETAVNQVGVNLNTASPEILTHISGLNQTQATNIVAYRNENGEFGERKQLKKVPRLGPKAYEQAVGFLRIIGGKNPLDNTDIHPENYKTAEVVIKTAGVKTTELGSDDANQKLNQLTATQLVAQLEIGEATLTDILASLKKPGRDLRDNMPAPLLRQDVLTMEDLKPGMELQGTVRNVIDFGAFVDIGVKQDGLVHISKMAKKFVKDPSLVVSVGDIVTVWVDSVDLDRHRIQLSMVDPQDE